MACCSCFADNRIDKLQEAIDVGGLFAFLLFGILC